MDIISNKNEMGMKWESNSLGEIVSISKGKKHNAIENGKNRYINIENLHNPTNSLFTDETGVFVEENDVIIAWDGANAGKVGVGFKGVIGSTLARMKIKNNESEPRFLYWFLESKNELIKSQRTGATIPHVNGAALKDLQIPLPPLPTQKRIADILDAADALRQKDQELLKKYDELAQAIFIDMFGDPIRNEKGWEKVKMEKLMKIVRGGSPRPIEKFLGGTFPWIKIGDATKGDDVYLNSTKQQIIKEGLNKTRLLPAGSLIFANCGVSLGFARIITFEGCIHDGWLAFSDFDSKKINKFFLLKVLNSITDYFRKSAPEGTQPNLNTEIIKNFELILPPIETQEKFEKILSSFKISKTNIEKCSDFSSSLFQTLIQKAFKGELTADE